MTDLMEFRWFSLLEGYEFMKAKKQMPYDNYYCYIQHIAVHIISIESSYNSLLRYAKEAVSRLRDVKLPENDLSSCQTQHNLSRWMQVNMKCIV